jgi:mannonate dehydratase
MSDKWSRRRLMQATGLAALAPASSASAQSAGAKVSWPPPEGPDTPKICLGISGGADEKALRQLKQIGVDYVLMGGPRIPWDEADLRDRMDRFKAGGITIINMMISGFNDVIWGRPGADAQIENVIKSIRVAGKVGLPVIEYNFYANRLMEGYKRNSAAVVLD